MDRLEPQNPSMFAHDGHPADTESSFSQCFLQDIKKKTKQIWLTSRVCVCVWMQGGHDMQQ